MESVQDNYGMTTSYLCMTTVVIICEWVRENLINTARVEIGRKVER